MNFYGLLRCDECFIESMIPNGFIFKIKEQKEYPFYHHLCENCIKGLKEIGICFEFEKENKK